MPPGLCHPPFPAIIASARFGPQLSHRVLLATPTTLIALLLTVANGWQQEALAENAREVQDMGRELYKRLATFGDHMARTGRSLSGAVDAYNKAVGSLERNVFPQARRFHELGVVGGADKEMPELEHIDATARGLEAPEFVGVPRGLARRIGPRADRGVASRRPPPPRGRRYLRVGVAAPAARSSSAAPLALARASASGAPSRTTSTASPWPTNTRTQRRTGRPVASSRASV